MFPPALPCNAPAPPNLQRIVARPIRGAKIRPKIQTEAIANEDFPTKITAGPMAVATSNPPSSCSVSALPDENPARSRRKPLNSRQQTGTEAATKPTRIRPTHARRRKRKPPQSRARRRPSQISKKNIHENFGVFAVYQKIFISLRKERLRRRPSPDTDTQPSLSQAVNTKIQRLWQHGGRHSASR